MTSEFRHRFEFRDSITPRDQPQQQRQQQQRQQQRVGSAVNYDSGAATLTGPCLAQRSISNRDDCSIIIIIIIIIKRELL